MKIMMLQRKLFCQISAASSEASMSITPYLGDFDANPETKRVLGVALEMTRVSLGLADDFANGIIAKRIVERAKAGERNPDLLCQCALEALLAHLYGDSQAKNAPIATTHRAAGPAGRPAPPTTTKRIQRREHYQLPHPWAQIGRPKNMSYSKSNL